jgi:endoglucanase
MSTLAAKLPRWRGFNLLEKYGARHRDDPFREADFDLMAEWGFDFARFPMSYHCWSSPEDWRRMDEGVLKLIDEGIKLGRDRNIHVCLNFHRAPGYCIHDWGKERKQEPFSLWHDEQALEACCHHWATFAERYAGIPGEELSFNLFNEAPYISDEDYSRVVRHVVAAIREKDRDRLIIVDGLDVGCKPVEGIIDLGVAQSTRGYLPTSVSHYRARWSPGYEWYSRPNWPLTLDDDEVWDRNRLSEQVVQPFREVAARGVGVHVGEWGAYNRTPNAVRLRWMRDFLELWQAEGWGWALWNFRGDFGVLDSGRRDVDYESFRGHQLDREMLELLQAH